MIEPAEGAFADILILLEEDVINGLLGGPTKFRIARHGKGFCQGHCSNRAVIVPLAKAATGLGLLGHQPVEPPLDRRFMLIRRFVVVAGAEEAEERIARYGDVILLFRIIVGFSRLALCTFRAVLIIIFSVPTAIGALMALEPDQAGVDSAFGAFAAAPTNDGGFLAAGG